MLHVQEHRKFQWAMMRMENIVVTIKRGEPMKLGEKPASVHLVHQESHTKLSGIEPGPLR
jgi:hypothetical protein